MAPSRILFGQLSPGLGGHTRTAVAVATVLRDRGYEIDFLVRAPGQSASGDWPKDSLIRAAGFRVVPISGLYSWSPRLPFRQHLRELVRREQYAAIHWLEFYDGVRDAAIVAKEAECAFVWTVTSGGVPDSYHGFNRVVVFTREVAEDARRRNPRAKVYVLPARIDFRALTPDLRARDRASIRRRFGIDDAELLVVRVARCARVYLRTVKLGIALVSRLNREGRRAVFLHAGYVQQADVAQEIRRLVDQANAQAGRAIAYSETDNVERGTPYAAAADVCIGSGRTAIEALALERPTFVAWGQRYLGMVDADNINAMSDTNFQGRQSLKALSDDDVVAGMCEALRHRWANGEAAARIEAACAEFVRERYSVESAVDTYERLYADRTVTVDGPLRALRDIRHLSRWLACRVPHGVWQSRPVMALRRARKLVVKSGADD